VSRLAQDVAAQFEMLTGRARLRGESVDEDQRVHNRDTVDRWGRAEGKDLENEAERTRQKEAQERGPSTTLDYRLRYLRRVFPPFYRSGLLLM
jgi:hypothetical protein